MSKETRLVKNTFILSIGLFLPKLTSFITLPIITAFLTKAEYGTYDLVSVLISLLLPGVTLQIQTAAFRFLITARKAGDETEIKKIITTLFSFVFPVSIVTLSVLWPFFAVGQEKLKALIAVYFIVDILMVSACQVARGLDRTKEYSVSAVISSVFGMLNTIVFVRILNLGLPGLLTALIISRVFSFAVIARQIRLFSFIDRRYISKDTLKTMLKYSWPMVPNGMSMWVMRLSDRLVVTGVLGISANAVYSVANKLPGLLHLAQGAFTMAWQENASIFSDEKEIGKYYSSVFRSVLDLTAGLFGLLTAFSPILFRLLIRGDYGDSYIQMPILFLAEVFFILATFIGSVYVAFYKTKSVGITTVVAAAINLLTNFLLIRRIGLYAASLSTLISYMVLTVYRAIDVRRFVKMSFSLPHVLLVMLIMGIELFLCYRYLNQVSLLSIAFSLLAFAGLNYTFIRRCLKLVKKKLGRAGA